MVREEMKGSIREGDWASAAGLGLFGALSSMGLVPLLVTILIGLGVGLFLIVYFAPILVAGGLAVFVYYLGKWAGLKKSRLLFASVMAGLGSLIVFNFVDITLFSYGVTAAGKSDVSAQLFGIFDGISKVTKLIQMIIGLSIVMFVLLGLFGIRMIGGSAGSMFAGFVGLLFGGVLIGDWFDISVPGLLASSGQTNTFALGVLGSVLVGILSIVLYSIFLEE